MKHTCSAQVLSKKHFKDHIYEFSVRFYSSSFYTKPIINHLLLLVDLVKHKNYNGIFNKYNLIHAYDHNT